MHSLLDRSVPLGYGNTKLLARRRLPGEGRADADSEPDRQSLWRYRQAALADVGINGL